MIQESDKSRIAACSPLVEAGQAAFQQSLEGLLRTHRGKWVAFLGEQMVCVAKTQTAAYAECIRRGLNKRDLAVRLVTEPVVVEFT